MEDKTYNGWTNYATWRINLEMLDGRDWNEEGENAFTSVSTLADSIQEQCEEVLESYVATDKGDNGINLVLSYAMAFLSDVNWYEIAQHIAEDYPKLVTSEAI